MSTVKITFEAQYPTDKVIFFALAEGYKQEVEDTIEVVGEEVLDSDGNVVGTKPVKVVTTKPNPQSPEEYIAQKYQGILNKAILEVSKAVRYEAEIAPVVESMKAELEADVIAKAGEGISYTIEQLSDVV